MNSADQRTLGERLAGDEPKYSAALRGIYACAGTALRQGPLSKRNALHEIIALAKIALAESASARVSGGTNAE